MAGVNVLNVVERTQLSDWAIICILLCAFVMAVFLVELLAGSTIKKIKIGGIGFTLAVVLILIFFWLGIFTSNKIAQYECTIDNKVSFVELYEKYDVIEQRGDIWVLEEKTNGKVD